MKNHLFKYIILLILALVFAVSLAACKEEAKAPDKAHRSLKKIKAQTTLVKAAELPLLYSFPGTTTAKASVKIGAKIPGYVKEVFVDEGDAVLMGQTLIKIDETDIVAKIKALEASRQAVLRKKRAVQSRLAYAEANYERIKRLFDMESATQEELDRATAEVEALKAQVKAVEAEAAAVSAQIREVKNQLNYVRITSPTNGWVVGRFADPGTLANPGMPLLMIDSKDAGTWFEAMVDEGLMTKIKEGQPVHVEIPAAHFAGSVPIARLIPQVDPASHSFKIKVDLASQAFKSGLFGTVKIDVGSKKALLIPVQAVVERGGIKGVFTVDADKIIHWRVIKGGDLWKQMGNTFVPAVPGKIEEGLYLEVLAGLSEGDTVVTSNLTKVQEGASLE